MRERPASSAKRWEQPVTVAPKDWSNEWTCEHGVVRAEGCQEYGCEDPSEMRHCDGCGEDYNAFQESHVGHQADQRARNRAAVEARYQEHLRLGTAACPCLMCRRTRGSAS